MSEEPRSTASESLRFTDLFEAELLARLMLWKWKHPLADDEGFVLDLVEGAAKVLRSCDFAAIQLIEGVRPRDMNFVAAAWYSEWAAVSSAPEIDPDGSRSAWLDAVRRALPSCFCDPQNL